MPFKMVNGNKSLQVLSFLIVRRYQSKHQRRSFQLSKVERMKPTRNGLMFIINNNVTLKVEFGIRNLW